MILSFSDSGIFEYTCSCTYFTEYLSEKWINITLSIFWNSSAFWNISNKCICPLSLACCIMSFLSSKSIYVASTISNFTLNKSVGGEHSWFWNNSNVVSPEKYEACHIYWVTRWVFSSPEWPQNLNHHASFCYKMGFSLQKNPQNPGTYYKI